MKVFMMMACLFSLSASAEMLKDTIHSIVKGDENTHLVRFHSGRVAMVKKGEDAVLEQAIQAHGYQVEAALDKKNYLVSLKSINSTVSEKLLLDVDPPAYTPSVVSESEIQNIYNRMNPNFKRRSECSDRAHVWAHDEFKKHGTMGQKAFIFVVNQYIIKHNFKWWFHVAPMYDVSTRNGVQKMVLDYQYKDRPVTVKEWSDMMIFSKKECKMTTKFSEYDVNPQIEDCYMMFVSMYYHFPGEIHEQETKGIYRSSFNDSLVNGARTRAFNSGSIQ